MLIIPLILASFSIATSPPILNRPLVSQLSLSNNSAVSSVFPISPSSALLRNTSTLAPALRVPHSWSFSIGLFGDTFLPAQGDSQPLSYAAQLSNGDPLPDWLGFDRDTLTFDGVSPTQSHGVQVFSIVITATNSDSLSTSDTFTLIVSLHDLSLVGPLLTRNVTADTRFSFKVNDWQGIQIDGVGISAASPDDALAVNWAVSDNNMPNLALSLNTASYPWLAYDSSSYILSGIPPISLPDMPGLLIPATVTLNLPTHSLTVSTNLTLDVFPSVFVMKSLPSILALPGTSLVFDIAPFISASVHLGLTLNAKYDPQNVTWLDFNPGTKSLRGAVPKDAPSSVKVLFTAHDPERGTDSRTEIEITIKPVSGDHNVRAPTDRALRRTGKKVTLAIGLVCGVIVAAIFLAGLLAVCRRYCAAHEHIDGACVVDQSAFDEEIKSSGAYEKEAESYIDGVYLTSPSRVILRPTTPEARMMTKGAFFGAVRERLGDGGSWPGRRTPHSSLGKRARKSKISRPMAMLSSSTSVRDGFADRARGGFSKSIKNNLFYSGTNFTIFGNKSNPHGSTRSTSANARSQAGGTVSSGRHNLSQGRVILSQASSPDTPVLAYERSDSSFTPSQNPVFVHGSSDPNAPRSESARSMGMGSQSLATHTGTQSTFATGDSTRLTNAAGEVPLRRPDFDGRHETLAERNMRMRGSPEVNPPKVPSPTTMPPTISPPKATPKATSKNDRFMKSSTSSLSPTTMKSSQAGSLAKTGVASDKINMQSHFTSATSKLSTHDTTLNTGSQGNSPVGSSYRNVFYGDKSNKSEGSSALDVEHGVIRFAVQHTSNETPAKQGMMGKPRLVPFTHERIPEAAGQVERREVSQKVVVHSNEDSDPESEMRMGLEYVRQLGQPEAKQEGLLNIASPSRVSSISSSKEATPLEFYASNDSNGSIAGRTRVMSHLVINSHRHRHQTAYSAESTHDSFVSLGMDGGSRWIVEAELPRILLGPGEPFNFAAPLDRAHKHASTLAGSALEAKQADGRPLPEWLRFRNVEREFWGVSPKTVDGEQSTAVVTRVVVSIWEAEKSVVVGGCVIDVLESE